HHDRRHGEPDARARDQHRRPQHAGRAADEPARGRPRRLPGPRRRRGGGGGRELREVGMRLLAHAVLLLALGVCPARGFSAPPLTPRQYEEDFDAMWSEIGASYAYFDKKTTNWEKVKTLYRPKLKGVSTREEFVGLLERVLEELYDPHTHLNTNTA